MVATDKQTTDRQTTDSYYPIVPGGKSARDKNYLSYNSSRELGLSSNESLIYADSKFI